MKERTYVFLLVMTLVTLLGGCATSGSQGRSGNSDHIETEEMAQAAQQYDTAYSIVQNLRPFWLRKRGRKSMLDESEIIVYVDGARYGSPEALRNISSINIDSMEFLTPAEATNRYGTGHVHGAILVSTKS